MGTPRVLRVVVAALSGVVLVASGVGWVGVAQIERAFNRSSVLDASSSGGEENILVVGLDSRTDAQGRPLPPDVLAALHAGASDDGGDNTDTMIVVHVPADGGSVSAYSLPRDAYVAIPGYGTHKINSAYTYAENADLARLAAQGVTGPTAQVQAGAAGARSAIATVEGLTGLSIDHYAAIDLAGFADVSDAVGGVPVCLLAPVHDPYSGANFPAGPQTIAGPAALAFVRQRHGLPAGDLDRVRRQQAFLAGAARTLLDEHTLSDPGRLQALDDAVARSVVVDEQWDLLALAGRLAPVGAGAVAFRTVPVVSPALATATDGVAVQVDPAQVAAFIAATDDPSVAPVATPTTTPAPDPTPVDVRNASHVDGAAAAAMTALIGHGLTRGATGDVAAQRTSQILYPPADRAAAQTADTALGGALPLVATPTATRIAVVLGTDRRAVPTDVPAPPVAPPVAPAITADQVPCVH